MMAERTAPRGLRTAVIAVLLTLLAAHGRASPQQSRPTKSPSQCPPDKFDCRNGKCITGSHWCDGIDHCGNNMDELSCRICLSGSVKCKASTQCVLSGARCNGKTECLDGSDELGCETTSEPKVETTSRPSSLQEEMTVAAGATKSLLSAPAFVAAVIIYIRRW